MPIYDCGDPDCGECASAFGPDRTAAIERFRRRNDAPLRSARAVGFEEGIDAALREMERHTHVATGDSDSCKRCGQNLRSSIHLRSDELIGVRERIRKLRTSEEKTGD